ncbi:hypothetical protein E2C01_024731 [Portunus trituberculatus]|uniref:Uncharacterized protein n=1 Tax=Portunus trituberculatus TaxID=210409 RepID=A0A5B7EBC2_PORTR|nr:hypothetical protein [Portunus trituberculatus]
MLAVGDQDKREDVKQRGTPSNEGLAGWDCCLLFPVFAKSVKARQHYRKIAIYRRNSNSSIRYTLSALIICPPSAHLQATAAQRTVTKYTI